jgi:hypothetical protein
VQHPLVLRADPGSFNIRTLERSPALEITLAFMLVILRLKLRHG